MSPATGLSRERPGSADDRRRRAARLRGADDGAAGALSISS